mmetsp:Transcript_6457/g.11650  ORF Transcript_6457/g.11650 Transcript_6457/m.11650 type:complete len:235 (+) Transcript_6457:619-1323(+)
MAAVKSHSMYAESTKDYINSVLHPLHRSPSSRTNPSLTSSAVHDTDSDSSQRVITFATHTTTLLLVCVFIRIQPLLDLARLIHVARTVGEVHLLPQQLLVAHLLSLVGSVAQLVVSFLLTRFNLIRPLLRNLPAPLLLIIERGTLAALLAALLCLLDRLSAHVRVVIVVLFVGQRSRVVVLTVLFEQLLLFPFGHGFHLHLFDLCRPDLEVASLSLVITLSNDTVLAILPCERS